MENINNQKERPWYKLDDKFLGFKLTKGLKID